MASYKKMVEDDRIPCLENTSILDFMKEMNGRDKGVQPARDGGGDDCIGGDSDDDCCYTEAKSKTKSTAHDRGLDSYNNPTILSFWRKADEDARNVGVKHKLEKKNSCSKVFWCCSNNKSTDLLEGS